MRCRVRAATGASAFVLALALFSGEFAIAQVPCPITQRGKVRYEDGSPAAGIVVHAFYSGGSRSGVTDAQGDYVICIPTYGSSTTISPAPAAGRRSEPQSRQCGYNGSCSNLDFALIRFRVSGQVVDVTGKWSVAGIPVEVDGVTVSLTDAQGQFAFRPLQVGVAPAGTLRPRQSFMGFFPPELPYLANTADNSVGQVEAYANVEPATAVVSWEIQNGAGWDYFPLDPRDVFPHNPNVYVTLDLDDASFSTPIPANRMRLVSNPAGILPEGGVNANSAASASNGYAVQFTHPIGPCGRANLSVETALPLAAGGLEWLPIETIASGTSRTSLNGDLSVNLADVGLFSSAMGKSEGEPGYNPCADYFPDGTIDLSDASIFSIALNWQESLYELPSETSDEPTTPLALARRLRIAPNPARGPMDFVVETRRQGALRMSIHDVSGRRIWSLEQDALPVGRHAFAWDGTDERGARVPRGLFFLRVAEGGESVIRTLVRLD